MKYEEDKVDAVQAALVPDSGNTGGVGGGVSHVKAEAFRGRRHRGHSRTPESITLENTLGEAQAAGG